MRQLFQEQPSLTGPIIEHRHAEELAVIDGILRDYPAIIEWVLQDLQRGLCGHWGREGMTADQVLRAALLKQMERWSYDELHFHLLDSLTYRGFTGFGWTDPVPGRSTLQRNIKRITEATWHAVNQTLLGHAKKERVENGRKVRVDATVTETTIHPPRVSGSTSGSGTSAPASRAGSRSSSAVSASTDARGAGLPASPATSGPPSWLPTS